VPGYDPSLCWWEHDGGVDGIDGKPAGLTSLDPVETCGFPCRTDVDRVFKAIGERQDHEHFVAETLSQTFRHEGWRSRREKVFAAFQRTNQVQARIAAFSNCGRECYVLQNTQTPEEYRLAASCCHDRFCLPCGSTRSRTITANLMAYAAGQPCRFVTLTLRTNDRPLDVQLDRLYEAFKTLRKSALWKNTQTGGIAFLELKRDKAGERWHPHFHILTQGKFLPQVELSKLWKVITTDSHIVDVRLVRDLSKATEYVTKYASKPMDSTVFERTESLDEAIVALKHRRLMMTFGNWKGLKATETPTAAAWTRLDTLDNMLFTAATGCKETARILALVLGDACDGLIARSKAAIEATRIPRTMPPPDTPLQLTLLF